MRLPRAVVLFGALMAASAALGQDLGALAPRAKPMKTPTIELVTPSDPTGRLVVKFEDAARARATEDGSIRFLGAMSPDPVLQIMDRYGLKMMPAIKLDENALAALQDRAESFSGRAQPDLAGMMYVYGRSASLEKAAKALNDLDLLEWVVIEAQRYPGGSPGAGGGGAAAGNTGACCLSDLGCAEGISVVDCNAIGGVYQGDGSTCPDPGCGACCLNMDALCRPSFTSTRCAAAGGVYQGDYTACDDTTIDCFLGGACCLNDGLFTCADLLEADCDAAGGTYQGDGTTCPGDFCGGCCVDEETCIEPIVQDACAAAGGSYIGDAVGCEGIDCAEVNNCGEAATGDCYDIDGNGSPFCTDEACCNTICEIDEYCCDDQFGQWDEFCAAEANWLCDGGDNCLSPLNGGCFEFHVTGGCNNEACCTTVCDFDPGCCDGIWDFGCVLSAFELCLEAGDPASTPDLEPLQGYLTAAAYETPLDADLAAWIPQLSDDSIFVGYAGAGWDLRREGESFTDLNGNGWWDPGEEWDDADGDGIWDKPGGLYGLGEELLYRFGIDESGFGNLIRGKKAKVAVIEWACYADHEDYDVTVERNQTLIMVPEATEPDHATACLGIIGAKENGTGVTGIVPEAKLLFYPLTSFEEGPRELTAWTNAIAALKPGDVISCSYGPQVNLNNTQETWTLIRLAADSGITVCIAAGNDCLNLTDAAPDLGDSGGIVVGACSPGAPWYRLSFSNFCTEYDAARSNVVHVKAWGENVTSTGYGNVFAPPGADGVGIDKNRAYTAIFNGTSAATPQIAGLAAAYQGLAKQFYGTPFPVQILRALLQQGTIGGLPSTRLFGTWSGNVNCFIDTQPDGYNDIGVYPQIDQAINAALTQTFVGYTDAPLLKDIYIVKGGRVVGNRFSVKGDDAQYLSIQSVFVDRYDDGAEGGGSQGGDYQVPEASSLNYLASGQSTDIIGIFETQIDNPVGMTVEIQVKDPSFTVLSWVEAYNWLLSKWEFLGVEILPNTDDDPESYIMPEAPSPRRFVREADGRLLVRNWNLGLTGFGNASGPVDFYTLMDLFDVRITNEFGEGG